jgi:hypothetical protein
MCAAVQFLHHDSIWLPTPHQKHSLHYCCSKQLKLYVSLLLLVVWAHAPAPPLLLLLVVVVAALLLL